MAFAHTYALDWLVHGGLKFLVAGKCVIDGLFQETRWHHEVSVLLRAIECSQQEHFEP